MAITIDPVELDPLVLDGAVLAGLLKARDAQPLAFNEDWFEHPADYLRALPQNPKRLLDLLAGLLDQPSDDIPSKDEAWFPIGQEGEPTGLYVILSADHRASPAHAGVGLWKQLQQDGIHITPRVCLPLFALTPGQDPRFVLGEAGMPLELVMAVGSNKEPFEVGSSTFTTLCIEAEIYFDGSAPKLAVSFLDGDGQPVKVYQSLQALLEGSARDWIDAVLSTAPVGDWLNGNIGSSKQTPGTLLADLKVLTEVDGKYQLADLSGFLEKTPLECAQELLFAALSLLADQDQALVPLGGDGIYVVRRGNADHYGLRVCLPDIALFREPASDNGEKAPRLLLQLGKWFTGEGDHAASWLKRAWGDCPESAEPGIAVYLVEKNDDDIAFKPRLELVSVGLDFVGGEKNPLVSVKGFELGGIEPRVYVALDFDDPSGVMYGYGVRLDRLGIPLGAQFDKLSGDNPVAANLLASGSGEGDRAPAGEKDAANPAFSVSGSYVDDLSVQLYGPDDKETDTVWFPVQRAYGPLSCRRIGVGWQDAERILSFLFDGSVSVDVLTIDLIGLSVGIPVTSPTMLEAYALGLDGLAVEVSAGPVEISGGLVETTDGDVVSYQGQALIKTATFAIDAYGAYTTVAGSPSLFIFALVDYPLGGPPCFFVTGLAAGFGYNSSVRIPTIEEVQDFPLLAAMADLSQIGGKDATPGDVLTSLGEWIRPERGAYWLAAGVSVRSFEIIKSNVLAVVEFGKEFEVLVLGLSTIKLPQEGHTYAYAELMIKIAVKPAEGVISAMALLSPNSYLFDPDCHLTGGFAFFVWFGDNPHAGDFVLTIGGYHPAFKAPAWYPQVPRLGFNWAVSRTVTIKGEAYFALTSSSVMAGGGLEVLYHSGNLKAWFIAHADMIIYWKPFYFEAGISVRIGVSYRVKFLFIRTTLKVELAAAIELWGPPTGGRARINWTIISFTVSFGAGRAKRARAVNWDGFKTMLPQKDRMDAAVASAVVVTEGVADRAPTDLDLTIIQINVAGGLLEQVDGQDGKKRWIIRPDEFAFSVEAAIPLTEAILANPNDEEPISLTARQEPIGIRPMGIGSIISQQTIVIHKVGSSEPLSFGEWDHERHMRNLPEAMWGQPVAGGLKAEANLIDDCLVGVKSVRLKPHTAPSGPPKFVAEEAFTYFPVDLRNGDRDHPDHLPLSATASEPATGFPTSDDSLTLIQNTLEAGAVREKRSAVFEALAGLGANAWTDGDLSVLAANPAASLAASPMIGRPVPPSGQGRDSSG
jgi:hypothetical protein